MMTIRQIQMTALRTMAIVALEFINLANKNIYKICYNAIYFTGLPYFKQVDEFEIEFSSPFYPLRRSFSEARGEDLGGVMIYYLILMRLHYPLLTPPYKGGENTAY
jgi:hypothetical protein